MRWRNLREGRVKIRGTQGFQLWFSLLCQITLSIPSCAPLLLILLLFVLTHVSIFWLEDIGFVGLGQVVRSMHGGLWAKCGGLQRGSKWGLGRLRLRLRRWRRERGLDVGG